MKKLVILLFAIASNHAIAYDAVDEIIEISEFREFFESQFAGTVNTIRRDETRADSKQQEIRELRLDFIAAQEQLFQDNLSWDSARTEVREIILNVYSKEEIEAYLEFLRKDAGKSFIKKAPKYHSEFNNMMVRRAEEFVKRKEDLFKEYEKQRDQIETN